MVMTGPWLIYGANGYTGALVARLAATLGHRPILAGRNADRVCTLAESLRLERRLFSLDVPPRIDEALSGMSLVLHCAGPFSRTSRPMADACLRTGTHYLDLTGEVAVIEALAARDAEARARGVMLLPGCGFDVVPSDCLALHLRNRLPGARRLALACAGFGGLSRGTAVTAIEGLGGRGWVRRSGVLSPVPAAWKTRRIDFGEGKRPAITIPLGDLSSAWHSTGIPDIEVYLAAAPGLRALLRGQPVHRPAPRLGGREEVPDRPREGRGGRSERGAKTPRPGLRVGRGRGRRGPPRGQPPRHPRGLHAHGPRRPGGGGPACSPAAPRPASRRPATAFGPDFVLGIPGVTRTDV